MTYTVEITQHTLNHRSSARSGIENSWSKGKAKVKGEVLLLYFHKNGAVLSLSG